MKTYNEAKREIQFSAVISGAVSYIEGKELVGKNGFWYLGGELVTDIERFLAKIPVSEDAIKEEMNR